MIYDLPPSLLLLPSPSQKNFFPTYLIRKKKEFRKDFFKSSPLFFAPPRPKMKSLLHFVHLQFFIFHTHTHTHTLFFPRWRKRCFIYMRGRANCAVIYWPHLKGGARARVPDRTAARLKFVTLFDLDKLLQPKHINLLSLLPFLT